VHAHFPANPPPPARQVTLYISGLFAGPAAPSAELRTGPEPLMRLLARADQLPGVAEGDTQRLFALFGITPEAGRDLPVAAVTRVADMGVIDREWRVRAAPVYVALGRA